MNIPITAKFPCVSPQRISLKNSIKNFCTPFTQIYQFLTSATFACILMYISIWCRGSVAKLCPTLCLPGNCSTPGFPILHCISQSLLKFVSIESVMPSNHLILCCPFFFLPSVVPSIRIFSIESTICIRWPKYWSFSISPFSEYSGLSSFRIDWFDILAVQGTLRVFSSTTTQKHQFFGIQPS